LGGSDAAVGVVGVAGSDDRSAAKTLSELSFGNLLGGVTCDDMPGFVTKDASQLAICLQ
jgi:hypothetical protein